ncbi:MAG: hypothetical protein K2H82_02215 [Oscillospiraceae bacterium]|nr:hypothetical protein [Oscillospiraceae bacterium]
MSDKKSRVNTKNFIVIHGWMIDELDIKGNELLVYAIIYGFSQTENQFFTGSLQYLADWTKSTKQGIMKNLKSLLEKNLIQKEEYYVNHVKFVKYYATKFNTPMQQSLIGYTTEFNRGMQLSLPNNINIENKESKNKINNSSKKTDSKSEPPVWFEEVWNMYPRKRGKNSISKKAYQELTEAGYDAVRRAIEAYRHEIQVQHKEEKFILNGSTFFNGRWKDYLDAPGFKEMTPAKTQEDEEFLAIFHHN